MSHAFQSLQQGLSFPLPSSPLTGLHFGRFHRIACAPFMPNNSDTSHLAGYPAEAVYFLTGRHRQEGWLAFVRFVLYITEFTA